LILLIPNFTDNIISIFMLSTNANRQMQRAPKPINHRTGCGLTNRREITQRQQDHRRSIARRGRSIEQFDLDPLLSESEDEDYQFSARCHIEMLMEEMRTLQARL
jgi:hypothetical protein